MRSLHSGQTATQHVPMPLLSELLTTCVMPETVSLLPQDDEDEDDYVPEGYYPDDGGTASNIDAAKTHISETRLDPGSQQNNGAMPANEAGAAEDGPGEASSPQLSDEQVRSTAAC